MILMSVIYVEYLGIEIRCFKYYTIVVINLLPPGRKSPHCLVIMCLAHVPHISLLNC